MGGAASAPSEAQAAQQNELMRLKKELEEKKSIIVELECKLKASGAPVIR